MVAPQAGVHLNDVCTNRLRVNPRPQLPPAPVSLLPLLMILTLLFLTFEGLLANRFYERPSQ